MQSKVRLMAVAWVTGLALAGCYGKDGGLQLHHPGKYVGANDPLLEIAGTPAFEQRLERRFNMVQTDR